MNSPVRKLFILGLFCLAAAGPLLGQQGTRIALNRAAEKRTAASETKVPSRTIGAAISCAVDESMLERRVFQEYGAVFAAASVVTLPDRCVLNNDATVR
jgi:hypothetical protein